MRFALGFLGGLLSAAVALYVYSAKLAPQFGDRGCLHFCGENTTCVDGRCQLVNVETPDKAADSTPPKRKDKRKRRRRPRRDGRDNSDAMVAKDIPWDNDSHVPAFDMQAIQKIDAGDASVRLDDFEINKGLRRLDAAFQRCIETADQRSGGQLSAGTVKISFGINGKGQVVGVNARAPKSIERHGIIPCVRTAVFAYKFPAYDGPTTRVETHFDVLFEE